MNILMIRHIGGEGSLRFEVQRGSDGKSAAAVEVPSPSMWPVQGFSDQYLMKLLRWYLEEFPDDSSYPDRDKAEAVLKSLEDWGRELFNRLFENQDAGNFYNESIKDGVNNLHLQIKSDDPFVLGWPWEVMLDPRLGTLAHQCHIERTPDRLFDPYPVSEKLPKECINILMVTARPFERDIHYRMLSRPILELIRSENLPAKIHVLRPPTFQQLKNHLKDNPDFYHLLHFDGHGGYLTGSSDSEGVLVFENVKGEPDPIAADKLTALLRDCAVPAVILNACQSAMIDENAENAFASVAAAMLKAGVRSVTAMAWSLHVNGAKEFLLDFYRELFRTGSIPEAVRAGRQSMLKNNLRSSFHGNFPLRDWLVPVVYQQDRWSFDFIRKSSNAAMTETIVIDPTLLHPSDALPEENLPYGLIGRDGMILRLEQAIRKTTPAVLIHGFGGAGKTTLVNGFLRWLKDTDGLKMEPLWLNFQEIQSAESVINRILEKLPVNHDELLPLPLEQKIALFEHPQIRQVPLFIIWDNFDEFGNTALMQEADRVVLVRFLQKINDSKIKVLITGRSNVQWIPSELRFPLLLNGLDDEGQWEFCERILDRLGLNVDRNDPDFKTLLKQLDGHPLAIRTLLPKLESLKAGEVLNRLGDTNQDTEKNPLFSLFQQEEEALSEEARQLLIPIAFHEKHLGLYLLTAMAQIVDPEWNTESVSSVLRSLANMGILRVIDQENGLFSILPIRTTFLRNKLPVQYDEKTVTGWKSAFISVMADLANSLTFNKDLNEQKTLFHIFETSFRFALREAEELEIVDAQSALLQFFGAFAKNQRNFPEAKLMLQKLAEINCQQGSQEFEATAYHHLGSLAAEQEDFKSAEKWYHKSLNILVTQGNEHDVAVGYHNLGMIAQIQNDFKNAGKWYQKSLAIFKHQGDKDGMAKCYHQLARVTEEVGNFESAEKWFRKLLEISEAQGNKQTVAMSYYGLGTIAQGLQNFMGAEKWYRKSLEIFENQEDEYGVAISSHQLGFILEEQRDFESAEKWYRKSMEIFERQGDKQNVAASYHQLGRIAQDQEDFEQAEKWYQKSLGIEISQGHDYGTAVAYHQLGMVALGLQELEKAEKWFFKSIEIFESLGNISGMARSTVELGGLRGLQENFFESGKYLIKAILIFIQLSDDDSVQSTVNNFLESYKNAPETTKDELKTLWEDQLGEFPFS